jgi:hypothetical protein
MINTYNCLLQSLRRSRSREESKTAMGLKEKKVGDVDWIHVTRPENANSHTVYGKGSLRNKYV